MNQIRIYSGEKFETAEEIHAGQVCALCGLDNSFIGQGFGFGLSLFYAAAADG